MLLLGIPLVILPIVFLGRRVRKISRAARTGSPRSARWSTRVLGAMKIVQAFGQEEREAGRFEGRGRRVFATAARILLRAVMTAIVIA
jgi:ATP-binding cassette subfamily B protein